MKLRGGSWNNDNPENLRAANRNNDHPENRNNNIGFRCAEHSLNGVKIFWPEFRLSWKPEVCLVPVARRA